MKKLILLVIPVLFLHLSCEIDDAYPQIENITSGQKWTLQIGSSPLDVYGQLQQLALEKNFNDVSIVYRQPFSGPNEIQSDIGLYRAITLETTSGVIERVLIQFNEDKVSSIEQGGALLDAIVKWPEDAPEETAIHINDPIDKIHEKLLAIYQIPIYTDYQIVLSDKWLEKAYDPDMKNYDEWAFVFSEAIHSLKDGRSSVRLYFKNERLIKIRHEYEEFDLVN